MKSKSVPLLLRRLRRFVDNLDEALMRGDRDGVIAACSMVRGFIMEIEEAQKQHVVLPELENSSTKDARCPHDGGTCHHVCGTKSCFREAGGMRLTTPYDGYPLPGHEFND